MPDELEDRVQRLEYAIFGLTGDNGLRSEVRGLRNELRKWRQERERTIEAERRDAEMARREKRRNRLTAIGITIAGLGSLAAAILQVVG